MVPDCDGGIGGDSDRVVGGVKGAVGGRLWLEVARGLPSRPRAALLIGNESCRLSGVGTSSDG
jgi:hypothetical protein